MIGVAVAGIAALAVTSDLSDRIVTEATDSANASSRSAADLLAAKKDIDYDIVQIQQYLTDVSATQALGGLGNDDWDTARQYRDRLGADLARARAIAERFADGDLLAVLDHVAQSYPGYYDSGVAMAHVYVQQGAAAGNKAMPAFDAATDKLGEEMQAVTKLVSTISAKVDDGRRSAAEAKDRYRSISLAIEILLGLLVVVAGAIVMRLVSRSLLTPLGETTGAIEALSAGDLDIDVGGTERDDEIGTLARALRTFRDAAIRERDGSRQQTERVVATIGSGLSGLAEGKLDSDIAEEFPQQFERLRLDFNASVLRLRGTLRSVTSASGQIGTGAQDISRGADELSRRTEHQAASLEQSAAALEEITATMRKTAQNAREVRGLVADARQSAQEGGQIVTTAVASMDEIKTSSRQIGDITGVIDEIAFQTNLLALNAGVEAARAGDFGKGFAVVASEVRALAQRAGGAARDIRKLIAVSGDSIASGVQNVDASGAALRKIVDQIERINGLVSEMASAAEQQSTGIEEVNTAVTELDQITQQNAAMVAETTDAVRSLVGESQKLSDTVAFFQLGEQAEEAPRQTAPQRARRRLPMAAE